jgi:hypothetical protein
MDPQQGGLPGYGQCTLGLTYAHYALLASHSRTDTRETMLRSSQEQSTPSNIESVLCIPQALALYDASSG